MQDDQIEPNEPDAWEQIECEQERVQSMIRKCLWDGGWTYTSDVPGSFCLWQATLPDGRIVIVPENIALSIQEAAHYLGVKLNGKEQ